MKAMFLIAVAALAAGAPAMAGEILPIADPGHGNPSSQPLQPWAGPVASGLQAWHSEPPTRHDKRPAATRPARPASAAAAGSLQTLADYDREAFSRLFAEEAATLELLIRLQGGLEEMDSDWRFPGDASARR